MLVCELCRTLVRVCWPDAADALFETGPLLFGRGHAAGVDVVGPEQCLSRTKLVRREYTTPKTTELLQICQQTRPSPPTLYKRALSADTLGADDQSGVCPT